MLDTIRVMKTNRVTNSLDSFQLYYEDMEKKKVKKAAKVVKKPEDNTVKPSLKDKFQTKMKHVDTKFSNVVNKAKHPRKPAKKMTKIQLQEAKVERRRGILGIGLLLVVVSIIFSTFVAIKFVNGVALYVALAPQIVFAAVSLFKAFSKIYK